MSMTKAEVVQSPVKIGYVLKITGKFLHMYFILNLAGHSMHINVN